MKFSKGNIKSPYVIIFSLVFYVFNGGFFLLLIDNDHTPLAVLLGLFILGMTFLLINELTTKIIFSEREVTYKSLFEERSIKWSNIKTYGVYAKARIGYKELSEMKYDKFVFAAQKKIYLSDKTNYKLNLWNKPKKGYIDFHYRRYILDEILSRINKEE